MQLSPLTELSGFWHSVPLDSGAGMSHLVPSILCFHWLPAALVCLELQPARDDHGSLQWKVICVLSAAPNVLPAIEHLEKGSLILRARVWVALPNVVCTACDLTNSRINSPTL